MNRSELAEWNRHIRDNPKIVENYCGIKFVWTGSMETMHFELIPNFKGLWRLHVRDSIFPPIIIKEYKDIK
jgi:hypothetical protein